MQNHATPCKNHVMPKSSNVKKKTCKKLFFPAIRASIPGESARPSKKNWPRKKEWQLAAPGLLNLRRGPGPRAALARGRAAHSGGPALLLPGPAASQQGPCPSSTARGPTTTSCCATTEEARALPAGRRAPAKLGKGFFARLRVPGPRAGDHPGRDWLPVNELGGATRHPAHLTEAGTRAALLQLLDKTSFLTLGPLGGQHPERATGTPERRWRRSCASE